MKPGLLPTVALLFISLVAGCGPSQGKPVNSGKDMPRPADKGR